MYKVAVICITYNHVDFISSALNSMLSQHTNFDYEIIICDDASTDGTQEIIRKYQKKHSNIKATLRSKNVGALENFIDCLNNASSKYLIVNEGDDYFTDPHKLQKQVDFLDLNPDCSICFHPVKVIWEDGSQPESIFPEPDFIFNKKKLSIDDLLQHNFIQTNSCMYRWRFNGVERIRDVFPKNIIPGDYFLHLLHAEKGKIGFIPDIMAIYRKHSGGIWHGVGKTHDWYIRCGENQFNFYRALEKHFKIDKTETLHTIMQRTIIAALATKNFELLNFLSRTHDADYAISVQKILEKQELAYKYKELNGSIFWKLHSFIKKIFIALKKYTKRNHSIIKNY